MAKKQISTAKQFDTVGMRKWMHNALVFAFPALIAFGVTLMADAEKAGTGVLVLYVMNITLDLAKKWHKDNS